MKKLILSALFCIAILSPIQAMAKPYHKIVQKQDADLLLAIISKNDCNLIELRSLDNHKDGYILVIYE